MQPCAGLDGGWRQSPTLGRETPDRCRKQPGKLGQNRYNYLRQREDGTLRLY